MTSAEFAQIMDRAYIRMRPWSEIEIAETLASPHTLFLTTEAGGLIARIIAGDCEILAIATDPAAQRNGHASRLLDQLDRHAAQHGAERIFLEVASQNTPARAFYAARGFAALGQRRGYYTLRDGTKDDALLLSRAVAQGQSGQTPTS